MDQLEDRQQIDGLKASLDYSAVDYLKAMRVRRQIQEAFRELFAGVDLLVAPTKLDLPDKADEPFDETVPKRPETKGVYAGLVPASNLCGLPALTYSMRLRKRIADRAADCGAAVCRKSGFRFWRGISKAHQFSQAASGQCSHLIEAVVFEVRQQRVAGKEDEGAADHA